VDQRNRIPDRIPAEDLQGIWDEWTEVHSHERLLTACFILDSRHSLLLGRANHMLNTGACLEQFVPIKIAVWDASTSSEWSELTQLRTAPTRSVYDFLNDVENGLENRPADFFLSALVISCYSASCTTTNALDTSVLSSGTHNIFRPTNRDTLSKALCLNPATQIMLRVVPLINLLPFRALISIAGESWFFSRKLSLDEYRHQKAILRQWANTASLKSDYLPSPHPTSAIAYSSTFLDAASIATEIISLALSTQNTHTSLAWGPEIAVYLSTLVLWAATYAGLTQARAKGRAPLFDSDSDDEHDREEWDLPQAIGQALKLVERANKDIENAQLGMHGHLSIPQPPETLSTQTFLFPEPVIGSSINPGLIFPPIESIASWMTGVESVIGWTKWMLEGGGQRSTGTGELVDGAVRVLESLERSSWTKNWF
jgi:hypothetical protein